MAIGIPTAVRLAFTLYIVWALLHGVPVVVSLVVQLSVTYEPARQGLFGKHPAFATLYQQMAYGELAFLFLLTGGTGYLIRTNQRRGKLLFLLYTIWCTYVTVMSFLDLTYVGFADLLTLVDLALQLTIAVLLLKRFFEVVQLRWTV